MNDVKSIAEWMKDRGLGVAELLAATGLDRKVLDRIVRGQYTPSPQQRQRLAAALGVAPEQIAWGHVNPVAHVYGHGPQFGRSP
jgi:transcriptional regulator with XRE-family HTH domain